MGWFDDQRQAQFLGCRNTIVFAAQNTVTRGRNTQAVPHLFGAQLVHRQRGSQDATAGVGDAGALQQALHAAVFTATAVEDDEGAVDLLGLQAGDEVIAHVDAEGVHACVCRASSTALPDLSETSRSALLPPNNTATRPKSAGAIVENREP
ncbi:hypothetical protein Ddc_21164 [Ditylenchus destructor]|nr:hypothetical protein Ddc_21164 [Ditylenchus destructor]